MARKLDELRDPESCLNKASDDEEVFILRAQDSLAPVVIRIWAQMMLDVNRRKRRLANELVPFSVQKKHDRAIEVAERMEQFQGRKHPD